jgi:hypothetical protein
MYIIYILYEDHGWDRPAPILCLSPEPHISRKSAQSEPMGDEWRCSKDCAMCVVWRIFSLECEAELMRLSNLMQIVVILGQI